MKNSFEPISNKEINFIKPDIEVEIGEIERLDHKLLLQTINVNL